MVKKNKDRIPRPFHERSVVFPMRGTLREQVSREYPFRWGKGEVALLCGPSGCGKTTVTRPRMASRRISTKDEIGTVRVCGLDVAHADSGRPHDSSAASFKILRLSSTTSMFGGSRLRMREPGISNPPISNGGGRFGKGVQSNIPDRRKPLFLSRAGQKQRVACASAAASSPALVVLDEPSSNLDFEAIAQLRAMAISRWKAAGTAVLVAEHRIHYLEGIADYVLYLDNGRLARRWTADEFARLDDAERIRLGLRAKRRRRLPKRRLLWRSSDALCAKDDARRKRGAPREPDGTLPEKRSPRENPRNRQPRVSRRKHHGACRRMWCWKVPPSPRPYAASTDATEP